MSWRTQQTVTTSQGMDVYLHMRQACKQFVRPRLLLAVSSAIRCWRQSVSHTFGLIHRFDRFWLLPPLVTSHIGKTNFWLWRLLSCAHPSTSYSTQTLQLLKQKHCLGGTALGAFFWSVIQCSQKHLRVRLNRSSIRVQMYLFVTKDTN